jgi:hypothetical protein
VVEDVAQPGVVVVGVVLRVVRQVVAELVADVVLGFVQPAREAVVQALVQRVVLVTAEAETDRVRDRVVQPVEPLVEAVVPEVVVEMTDLDVPPGRHLDVAVLVSDRLEEPVTGIDVMTDSVHTHAELFAETVVSVLLAETDVAVLGFRAAPEMVVVPAVI